MRTNNQKSFQFERPDRLTSLPLYDYLKSVRLAYSAGLGLSTSLSLRSWPCILNFASRSLRKAKLWHDKKLAAKFPRVCSGHWSNIRSLEIPVIGELSVQIRPTGIYGAAVVLAYSFCRLPLAIITYYGDLK